MNGMKRMHAFRLLYHARDHTLLSTKAIVRLVYTKNNALQQLDITAHAIPIKDKDPEIVVKLTLK